MHIRSRHIRDRRIVRLAFAALGATAVVSIAACGSSASTAASSGGGASTSASSAAGGTELKTTTINGQTVLTNAAGFTVYWFAPDTPTTSNCNGSCATFWPPVPGPATAGPGVTGTLGTITRQDGSTQATYDGHPLYTYKGDTAPGQAKGDGLNVSGGVWHEMTVSGAAPAPAPSSAASSKSGYGY